MGQAKSFSGRLRELWASVLHSTDLEAVDRLVELADEGAGVTALAPQAIEVLWAVLAPQVTMSTGDPADLPAGGLVVAEPLRDVLLPEVLDQLEFLEQVFGLSPRPDFDIPSLDERPDALSELLLTQHLALTRGILLGKAEGFTEATRDAFDRARTAAHALGARGAPWLLNRRDQAYSAKLAHAMSSYELGLAEKGDGNAQKALRFFTESLRNLTEASEDEEFQSEEDYLPGRRPRWLDRVEDGLLEVSFEEQELVDIISRVLDVLHDADWEQLADDCTTLMWAPEPWLDLNRPVEGWGGSQTSFFQFLIEAQARASERRSPDSLRRLLHDHKEEDARDRLKRYFFAGGLWDDLPSAVQRHLTHVDGTWAQLRSGGFELVLPSLKIATEELYRETVLLFLKRDAGLNQWIEQRISEKKARRQSLNLGDFADFCKDERIKEVAQRHGIDQSGANFLTQRLPRALRRLSDLRNPAEHEGAAFGPREVEPVLREFLGIGRTGVLPELARLFLAHGR